MIDEGNLLQVKRELPESYKELYPSKKKNFNPDLAYHVSTGHSFLSSPAFYTDTKNA